MRLKASPKLLKAYLAAETKYHAAKRQLEDDALTSAPWARGDIIRDKHTGATYRIEKVSAWTQGADVRMALYSTRVYATGRRDARSYTNIYNADHYEKVVDKTKPVT